MTAQNQPQSDVDVWQTAPERMDAPPGAILRSWLIEPGLLTRRLQQQCGSAFRLQLVNETHSPASNAHSSDLYRQVALCCGDEPCIYAESRIPLATANAHFWLRDLGNAPLGERLQNNADVTRGTFVYSRQAADILPQWIRATLGADVADIYARRSCFYLGEHEIEVTEYFLPGVVHCGTTASQA